MGEMLPHIAEDGHTISGYRDYGGAIAEHAQEKPLCPVLHVYPAGRGFNCDERGSYHEPSATLACTRTLDFLKQYLG